MSYRRDDVPDATDRLAESLIERFGKDHVFLDVDSIEIGSDFGAVVAEWIGRCDVLLAVIGRGWVNATDGQDHKRLANPSDYVRLEIEAGLRRDTRVVPVLIHGASVPRAGDLPESLAPLLDRQAVELSRAHWDLDVDGLCDAIERIAARKHAEPTTVARERTVVPPPPRTRDRARSVTPPPQTGRRVSPRQTLALGVLALVALGVIVAVLATSGSSPSPHSTTGWTSQADLPLPLEGAGVTAYKGEVWVAGGCSNPTGGCKPNFWLDRVYHYSPQARTWETGPPLPAIRNHVALVSDASHLYAIGGFGPQGQAEATVFRLDSPGGTWQTDPRSLPDARGAGAAAWDGTRIVFAGGGDASGHVRSEVWALQAGGWTQIGQLQQPRKHLAAATNQSGTVWFAGGATADNAASALVDLVSGQSVRSAPTIPAVKGAPGVAVGAGFCTIGGATAAGITGQVECQPHLSIPALTPARNYAGATVLDNRIYVVGGFGVGKFGGMPSVETLDTSGLH